MNQDIHDRLIEGIKKFNNKKFYECHDILEDVWFAERGKDRTFYQGLIHLAVGFYHVCEKKNSKGALLQLTKGLVKLKPFKPEHEGIELTKLIGKTEKCLGEIEKLKKGKNFDFKLIPKIKSEILNRKS